MLATTVPHRLSDGVECTFSMSRDKYLAYYLADLVLFYATPLLTAIVLYALIARKLLRRTGPVAHCHSRRPTGDGVTTPATRDAADAAASSASDTSSNVQVRNDGRRSRGSK